MNAISSRDPAVPISNSIPVYMSSVFSRTTTRSTSLVHGGHARVAAAGPDVRVQVELLAQRDVRAAQAAVDRRLDRALQRDAASPDRGERGRRAAARPSRANARRPCPGVPRRPRRRSPRPTRRAASITSGPIAVAGDQRDAMRHEHASSVAACRGQRNGAPTILAVASDQDAFPRERAEEEQRARGTWRDKGLREVVAAETKISDIDGEQGRLWYVGYEIERPRRARHVRGGRLPPPPPASSPPRRQLDELDLVPGRGARPPPLPVAADADARAEHLADVDAPHLRLGGLGVRPRRLGRVPRGRSTARRCG